MANDERDGGRRKKKGQTERLPAPGEEIAPLSFQDTYADPLNSGLDPVRSDDIAGLDLPDVAYENLTGQILGGRYMLDKHLADGGMGSIYIGTHLHLSMPIAVKVMLPSMSNLPGYTRRFRREARAMSAVTHRNIVRVMDFGIDDDRPYIVMELLEGQSVAEWLHRSEEPPTLREVDEMMRQVLDGLAVAHGAGIVHRDLKPDNMFLAQEGDGVYILKLLDFGLAHIDDPSDIGPTLTKSGMVSGTPEYMSPEQCQSLQVGPSTDIYAVGCILTELLQGTPPFDGDSHMLIMSKQMFMDPPAMIRPAGAEPIPPLLERLRRDMLAKDPAQRPKDVAAVRERWLEAVRPESNAKQFPDRKDGPGAGTRTDRLPEWTAPEPAMIAGDPSVTELLRVGLVRLHPGAFDDKCIVGLASGGAIVSEIENIGEVPNSLHAVIVDAAGDIDGVCEWLAAFEAAHVPRPLVCIDTSGDQMGRLLAAGAGDLVNYPPSASNVLRKLRKLVRRFRRKR